MAIINQNVSEKILFKYWDILNKTKEEQLVIFQSKQDALIAILEEQFKEDDINLLNLSLIKLLISLVIESELKKFFEETLKNSKSYKILEENFEVNLVEKVKFLKLQHLKTSYAYLHGFTRFKSTYLL